MNSERDLIQQLKGRAKFCRDRGEVKTPDLLDRAVKALEKREGYKLVPVDPESEVIKKVSVSHNVSEDYIISIYKAIMGVIDDEKCCDLMCPQCFEG